MSPAKRNTRAKARHDDIGSVILAALKNAGSTVNNAAESAGLADKVAQSPYGAVAAALAVGYVAGGGLFTATTARVIELGLKLTSVPFIRSQLLDIAEGAVDSVLEQTRKIDPK